MLPSNLAIFIFLFFYNLIDFTSSDNAQPSSTAAAGPKRRLKILVYCPAMSFSHSQFMGAIADTLQEAGHEVHFFKPILNLNLLDKNETQLVKKIYSPQPRFVDFSKYAVEDTDSVKNAFAGIWPTISAFGHPAVDFLPLFNSLCEEHPNLRAFISHCGQNSITEAARAGVPIIGIPLFGDQLYNSIMTHQKRMAVHLDVRQLSKGGKNAENLLIFAIKTILNNQKYRQNAVLIKKKLELNLFKPTENVIRWVEFAAEFTDLNELNLPDDDDMHWTVYYSLDVIGFSIFGLLAILWLSWKCAKFGVGLALRIDGPNFIKAKFKAH